MAIDSLDQTTMASMSERAGTYHLRVPIAVLLNCLRRALVPGFIPSKNIGTPSLKSTILLIRITGSHVTQLIFPRML